MAAIGATIPPATAIRTKMILAIRMPASLPTRTAVGTKFDRDDPGHSIQCLNQQIRLTLSTIQIFGTHDRDKLTIRPGHGPGLVP